MLEKAALKRGGQPARGRRGRGVPRVGPRVVRHRRDHPRRRRLVRQARVSDDRGVAGRRGPVRRHARRPGRGRPAAHRPRHLRRRHRAARDAARVLRAQPVRPRRDPGHRHVGGARAARRARVFTAADLNPDVKEQWHTSIGPASPETPRPPLAEDEVRFVGDPVALVVAESRYARRGRRRAGRRRLRAAARRSSTTPTAEDADALVHERHGSNVIGEMAGLPGVDARRRVRRRPRTWRARRSTSRRTPRCRWRAAASSSTTRAATGELTIYAATQSPHEVRLFCARLLGIPEHRIRVVMRDTGGGFGQKIMVQRDEMCLMLAGAEGRRAGEVGRGPAREPARRRASRATSTATSAMAFDADGAIQAAVHRLRVRLRRLPDAVAGRHRRGRRRVVPRPVPRAPRRLHRQGDVHEHRRPLAVPRSVAVRDRSPARCCSTSPRAQMGIDPVELRRRNLLRRDELPYTNPNGMTYDSISPLETFEQALEMLDYDAFRAEQADGARATAATSASGISTYVEPSTPGFGYYAHRGGDDPHRAVGQGQRLHRRRVDREQHRDDRRPAHRRRARRRHRRRRHDPGRHRGDRLRRRRRRQPQRLDDRRRGARDGGDPARAHRRHRRAQARGRRRRHRAGRQPGERAGHARRSACRSPRSPRSRTSTRTRCRPACPPGSRRARGTRRTPVDLGERHARVHVRGRRRAPAA